MATLARRIAAARSPAAARAAASLARSPASRRQLGTDPIVGITNFSTLNYLASQAGGGEPGVASGFGEIVQFRLNSLSFPTAQMLGASTNGAGGTKGYQLYISTGGVLTATASNGAGSAYVNGPTRTFVASDVGKVFVACVYFDSANVVRLWCSRDQSGSGTATTGYTPDTLPAQWQGTIAGGFPATAVTICSSLTFRGNPSSASFQALFDATRVSGDLPTPSAAATLLGVTVTHHWSAKVELSKLLDQSMPKQLTDNVTAATADALVQPAGGNGLKIDRTDPTVDGTRTLGAQNFSLANYYYAPSGGLAGAQTGHWISWYGRFDAAPAALGVMCGRRTSSPGQQGFGILANGTTLYFEQVAAGGAAIPNINTPLTSAMLGVPKVITGVFTGASNLIQLYVDGVAMATPVACVGLQPVTTPFRISGLGDNTFPASNVSWFGDVGGLGVPTPQQIADHAAATLASGRVQSIPGLTTMLHDPSLDIFASGVDAAPATVLDRVGTANLTRFGSEVAAATVASSTGVSSFTASQGLVTANPGGIAGANGGWHIGLRVYIPSSVDLTSATRHLMARANASNAGYELRTLTDGTLQAVIAGGGGVRVAAAITVTAGMRDRWLYMMINHTGAAFTLYLDTPTTTATATQAGFTPFAGPMYVGNFNLLSFPASDGIVIDGVMGGNTSATAGEITQAFADAAATSDVPTIAGKTTGRWSFKSDIAANGGVLPQSFAERISGAVADTIMRVNMPLVLAQYTKRIWSFEIAPSLYAGQSWTDADYYSAAGGFVPSAKGYWISLLIMILGQSSAATRMMFAKGNSLLGTDIRTNGLNSTIQMVHRTDGAGGVALTTSGSIGAADVGKVHLFTSTYDPSVAKVRAFWKRSELTAVTAAAFAPDTSDSCFLGRYSSPSFSAGSIAILGVAAGNNILSPADHFAQYDACIALERMAEVPNKTDFLLDFTLEKAIPATITDRKGGQNLTRTGAPALLSQFARAWGI